KKTENLSTTYLNDLYEVTGEVEKAFIMAGDLKLATVEEEVKTFYHLDHLSGASISTNEKGEIVEQMDYLPYGSSRVEEQNPEHSNDHLFTGQERDEETGLYYYGARYYDPTLG